MEGNHLLAVGNAIGSNIAIGLVLGITAIIAYRWRFRETFGAKNYPWLIGATLLTLAAVRPRTLYGRWAYSIFGLGIILAVAGKRERS